MKTIEERAKEFADNYCVGDAAIIVDLIHKVAYDSYLNAATEQVEIDEHEHNNSVIRMYDMFETKLKERKRELIDKACEIFDNAKKLGLWNIDFRKAMEE